MPRRLPLLGFVAVLLLVVVIVDARAERRLARNPITRARSRSGRCPRALRPACGCSRCAQQLLHLAGVPDPFVPSDATEAPLAPGTPPTIRRSLDVAGRVLARAQARAQRWVRLQARRVAAPQWLYQGIRRPHRGSGRTGNGRPRARAAGRRDPRGECDLPVRRDPDDHDLRRQRETERGEVRRLQAEVDTQSAAGSATLPDRKAVSLCANVA